jgi:hypothetical protein
MLATQAISFGVLSLCFMILFNSGIRHLALSMIFQLNAPTLRDKRISCAEQEHLL